MTYTFNSALKAFNNEGYLKEVRRADKERPELTLLKQMARDKHIPIPDNIPEARLLEDLWMKIKDHPSGDTRGLIQQLRNKRLEILTSAKTEPQRLIKWLYENQGVRRFDAANRFFLVLVNCENFFESWKLKRAKPLLEEKIHSHLDALKKAPGFEITFEWEGIKHRTRSDVIIIDHNH